MFPTGSLAQDSKQKRRSGANTRNIWLSTPIKRRRKILFVTLYDGISYLFTSAPHVSSQKNSTAKPSFTYYALDKLDCSQDIPFQEQIIMQTAASMFSGGFMMTMSVVIILSYTQQVVLTPYVLYNQHLLVLPQTPLTSYQIDCVKPEYPHPWRSH
jgi:hypothetical protein